jgi:S1-C subfamily serine protease
VEVTGFDGRERTVRRTTVDHTTGLALVTAGRAGLRPARIEETHEARPGLPIFLLTCTRDGERKSTTGHVSVIGPFEAFWEYMLDNAIMTTAINPGLAGAPLFDLEGRLLGLVSLGLAAVGRYSLAIPVRLYLDRRAQMEADEGPAPDGLGRLLSPGLRRRRHRHGGGGGRPADRAGVARGDLVLSLDGQSVSNLRELYTALWRKAPGRSSGLQILRDSAIRVVEITAGDRDEFYK